MPYANDDKTIKFLFLPSEHDPDSFVRELGAAAFERQIADSTPLSQFLLREAIGENDLGEPEGRARTQYDAKPLLQALPANALRMQIVRALAQVTGSNPAEVEALCELAKPVARAAVAPPRNQRSRPPPLTAQMLRLLVAHPVLAREIDAQAMQAIEQAAPDHADDLRQLVEAGLALGERASFAMLAEHLRNHEEFAPMIRQIAAEPEQDFDACRLELRAAVRKTRLSCLEQAMAQLMNSGLPAAEIAAQYREINQQISQLRQQAEAEKGFR